MKQEKMQKGPKAVTLVSVRMNAVAATKQKTPKQKSVREHGNLV